MLEMRPGCEACDKDLPPEAEDARICTYECTFCADCVEHLLNLSCNDGQHFDWDTVELVETAPGSSLCQSFEDVCQCEVIHLV